MNNKISFLLSLTLLTLVPSSNPYTNKDLKHLQVITEIAAFIDPILNATQNVIPRPETNAYHGRTMMREGMRKLDMIGKISATVEPILAAATESDPSILSTLQHCLARLFVMNPRLITNFTVNNSKETALELATIMASYICSNISGKAIKRIAPGNSVRIIRRILRTAIQSAQDAGLKVGADYIGNTLLSLPRSWSYKDNFFEKFAVNAVSKLLCEICGEVIAWGITEEPLVALLTE